MNFESLNSSLLEEKGLKKFLRSRYIIIIPLTTFNFVTVILFIIKISLSVSQQAKGLSFFLPFLPVLGKHELILSIDDACQINFTHIKTVQVCGQNLKSNVTYQFQDTLLKDINDTGNSPPTKRKDVISQIKMLN